MQKNKLNDSVYHFSGIRVTKCSLQHTAMAKEITQNLKTQKFKITEIIFIENNKSTKYVY